MSPKNVNTTDASDVDNYLAALPEAAREALSKLRQTIKSVVPEATEVISYRVPTFKYRGSLVAYAAFPDHCSFFVMSPAVMEAHKADLKGYDTSKGTIHFSPDKPLPESLVKKLVQARLAENEARAGKSRSSK
ncbi:MAG: DUF1801 domain-containing protein [Chloroflexi bacterium]|nr:DUF1801 domain-containing protein [Chloroflexota bacterium]MCI0574910.1 DUF1801 domain-containing protein [Chloroflexota bacterium]MCI0647083.1 DUF1801 domain-containing protein [Chloroflexota bacterium]MCI0727063.1 DUF1801 domain-containing protein [Chloroflexota bacterium]